MSIIPPFSFEIFSIILSNSENPFLGYSINFKFLYVLNDLIALVSFEEALRIDNALKHTYKSLGYQPVVIPKCSIAERVTFIEQYLKL